VRSSARIAQSKKIRNKAMQYIRRRIQRVSGVTIRDERVESRDFSVPSWREDWDDLEDEQCPRAAVDREARLFNKRGIGYRERT
jgi:hypothetical protein